MAEHAAVRAGDERATFELLQRLARQAAPRGNYPPPSRGNGWTDDDISDLIGDVFEHKAGFLEKAFVETTDDGGLERYLLRVFENRLRDQARQTQRSKLIDRLETLLGRRRWRWTRCWCGGCGGCGRRVSVSGTRAGRVHRAISRVFGA